MEDTTAKEMETFLADTRAFFETINENDEYMLGCFDAMQGRAPVRNSEMYLKGYTALLEFMHKFIEYIKTIIPAERVIFKAKMNGLLNEYSAKYMEKYYGKA